MKEDVAIHPIPSVEQVPDVVWELVYSLPNVCNEQHAPHILIVVLVRVDEEPVRVLRDVIMAFVDLW